MRVRSRQLKTSRGAALVLSAIGVALWSAQVDGQVPAARPGVLRPGLVIDAAGGVGYVMAATGGIAAVDLTTGATRWTSTVAAKPLLLVGDLLVAQVEPRTQSNRLGVVTLRTRTSGQRASSDTLVLPADVRVSVGETLHGTFNLTAQAAGPDVILHWSYLPAPKRGIDEEADSLTRAQAAAARPLNRRGAVRLRLATGAMTSLTASQVTAPREPRWLLPAEGKVSGAAPTQYESADGRHVVASERMADDPTWDKYRWTVFERGGRRVGELRTHVSFSPFVVRDSLVVFETTPYERAAQPAEPAKLRAFSLTGGREVWSVPVREIVFRGPYPP